jgi:ubiquinone/menaquinone biosynthesis C-methylase UbiE
MTPSEELREAARILMERGYVILPTLQGGAPVDAAPLAAMIEWNAKVLQWAGDWTNVAQWGLDCRELASTIRRQA